MSARKHNVTPWLVTIFVVLAASALVACSSGNKADQSANPSVPSANGDSCQDPPGDLSSDAKSAGVGTDPQGIDLTAASAQLQPDNKLAVSFTTVGPITDTPGTTFVVAQGAPATALAFEIRSTANDDGTWAITAITWDPSEKSTSMPVKPTVSGNQMSFTVPLDSLPPLALYMEFGTSSDVAGVGRVIDDCSSLATAPTVG